MKVQQERITLSSTVRGGKAQPCLLTWARVVPGVWVLIAQEVGK